MHTVQDGLTGGMVYSTVGDPIEMDKNPAYESLQVKEGGTEGELYEGIVSNTTIEEEHKNTAYESTQVEEGGTEGELHEGIISDTTIEEEQPMKVEIEYP